MLKALIVLAVSVGVLSSTGCCWPMHGGRYRYYDGYSEAQRPGPPGRYHGERGERGDGRH